MDTAMFLGIFEQNKPNMTADNQLKSTAIDRTLKSCRAYFRFTPSDGVSVKAMTFSLHFGDEETGIDEVKDEEPMGIWYDLSGRKTGNRKLSRGVYIRNGKKIVVK